jgi:selenoprotein W-related protein
MSDVSIIYCRPCGYVKRARDVAIALREQLSLAATLVPGTGGIFEVKVGEKTVAKRSKGHFPGPAEVVEAVAAARK